MSEPPRPRPAVTWQAIVAATVLALTAAGMVLFVASRDEAGETAAGDGTTSESVLLRPADEVPDDPLGVEFTTADGANGTLRGLLDGEPLVVNLFASWCPPCIAEMPDFEAVSRDVGEQVRFFGLAVNDRPEDASRIVADTGITYEWSRDPRGDIAGAFGITAMPSTVLIAPDGEVVHIQPGAVGPDELRSLLDEHLGVAV